MTAEPSTEHPDHLGPRLRASRMAAGLSLRETARQLGVSPSFVSQIENGKSQPSVGTLYSLSRLLGTSIDALFQGADAPAETGSEPPAPAAPVAPAAPGRPAAVPAAAKAGPVSRSSMGSPADAFARDGEGRARVATAQPGGRPRIVMDSGVVWEQLVANTPDGVDFIEIVYPPHAASTTDSRMLQHSGFEYGYVLEGEFEITVGFESFVVRAGESVGFDSAVPHLMRNPGDVPARGIWFVHHTP